MATSPTSARAATSGAEMMKTVKAAWDKAPTGPKKDAALKHYEAAEGALKAQMSRVASRRSSRRRSRSTRRRPLSEPRLPGAALSLALAELEAYPSGDICGIGVDLVRRQYGGRNGLEPR
jgi:hypothetical protein